jgi:hypothetical protein
MLLRSVGRGGASAGVQRRGWDQIRESVKLPWSAVVVVGVPRFARDDKP